MPTAVSPAEEIRRFQGLWSGGYFEGNPEDPLGRSSYFQLGYISTLYAVYQACVRPQVKPEANVLEIGPGRGAWTKTLLGAREIWCLDALSAEYNRFWEHVGRDQEGHVRYLQVQDFSCSGVPDNHFDFLFSFGTFCHLSWPSQCEYYRNLFPKLKPGAVAVIMIADYDKFNQALRIYQPFRICFQRFRKNVAFTNFLELADRFRQRLGGFQDWQGHADFRNWTDQDKVDSTVKPGRWYHAGTERTCRFLESVGWEVLNPDVGLCPRDPIVHFRKPA